METADDVLELHEILFDLKLAHEGKAAKLAAALGSNVPGPVALPRPDAGQDVVRRQAAAEARRHRRRAAPGPVVRQTSSAIEGDYTRQALGQHPGGVYEPGVADDGGMVCDAVPLAECGPAERPGPVNGKRPSSSDEASDSRETHRQRRDTELAPVATPTSPNAEMDPTSGSVVDNGALPPSAYSIMEAQRVMQPLNMTVSDGFMLTGESDASNIPPTHGPPSHVNPDPAMAINTSSSVLPSNPSPLPIPTTSLLPTPPLPQSSTFPSASPWRSPHKPHKPVPPLQITLGPAHQPRPSKA